MSDPSAYFKNKLIAACAQMSVAQTKAMLECADQVTKMPLRFFDKDFEVVVSIIHVEKEEEEK